jgi:hypothetical protein
VLDHESVLKFMKKSRLLTRKKKKKKKPPFYLYHSVCPCYGAAQNRAVTVGHRESTFDRSEIHVSIYRIFLEEILLCLKMLASSGIFVSELQYHNCTVLDQTL